jgi:C-terminal processing protease CtpA/Prc
MFRSYLKRSFAAIARNPRVTNLVLDLRRNDGGYTDHEIRLHSYLASDPFHEMRTSETRTITIADKHLLDPDWYSRGLTRYMERRLAKEFDPAGEDLFTVDDDFNPVHQPHRHHFKGTLYVLTSGRTHSAAASLCSMLDRDGPTIFVGEETGGVRTSFTAGNILGYLLPNSRVQLAIPIIQYHFLEQPGQEAGRGVIPDHPVARTRVDFVTNKDRALERVLQLIDRAASN